MNISKINQSIADFCKAAGFEFGGKQNNEPNFLQTQKFILEEFEEFEKETHQTLATKELIDICYFALTEFWHYGATLPNDCNNKELWEKVIPSASIKAKVGILMSSLAIKQLYSDKLLSQYALLSLCESIRKEVEAMNFDFQKCFDVVHQSNMSKFLTSKHDAEIALIECESAKDGEGEPKYGMLGIVECGGVYSIKDANSGKVVKEHNFYHKADLSCCVKLK